MNARMLGIIGCGAIGKMLGDHMHAMGNGAWQVKAVCALHMAHAQAEAARWGAQAMGVEELVRACDFVVEATCAAAMPGIVRQCLLAHTPVLTMSVGGFALEPHLMEEIRARAPEGGGLVHVPSGAIAGLDGILALREHGLDRVELISVKHPRSLPEDVWNNAAPHDGTEDVPAGMLSRQARCIFKGSAGDAIRAFPANANMAIAVSLAGLGFTRTLLRIFADPEVTSTLHCLRAAAGRSTLEVHTRQQPLDNNPRSSRMAVDSALALLRKEASVVRVGT